MPAQPGGLHDWSSWGFPGMAGPTPGCPQATVVSDDLSTTSERPAMVPTASPGPPSRLLAGETGSPESRPPGLETKLRLLVSGLRSQNSRGWSPRLPSQVLTLRLVPGSCGAARRPGSGPCLRSKEAQMGSRGATPASPRPRSPDGAGGQGATEPLQPRGQGDPRAARIWDGPCSRLREHKEEKKGAGRNRRGGEQGVKGAFVLLSGFFVVNTWPQTVCRNSRANLPATPSTCHHLSGYAAGCTHRDTPFTPSPRPGTA